MEVSRTLRNMDVVYPGRQTKDMKKRTYLTSVGLGNDGHCLYLMCLLCFTIVGRKKKKEREKRCESKGKETTRVMTPNALKMSPNRLFLNSARA